MCDPFKADFGNSTCFNLKNCSVMHANGFSSSVRARTFLFPAAVTPHKTNYGLRSSSGNSTGFDPVEYPVGFQSTLNATSDITYMDAAFEWRIPLRPFLGTIGEWVSGFRVSRISRIASQLLSLVLVPNMKTK
jgi:hypothetical protein